MPANRKTDQSPASAPRRRNRRPEPPTWSGRAANARRAVRWALAFLSILVAVEALVGDKGLIEMLRARRLDTELSGSIERLRSENARLREAARRLKEDPTAVEELARRELGLIRPGEVLFVVKDRTKP
jgi:cell division protein FtsB